MIFPAVIDREVVAGCSKSMSTSRRVSDVGAAVEACENDSAQSTRHAGSESAAATTLVGQGLLLAARCSRTMVCTARGAACRNT